MLQGLPPRASPPASRADLAGGPPGFAAGDTSPLRARAGLMRVLLLLAFGALALQLWRLQIVEARLHRAAAEGNRLRVVAIPPLRGVIYDRNLTPLAVNSPMFVVTVTEADLPSARRQKIIEETARILGASVEEIEHTLRSRGQQASPFTPITIRENVSREVALLLEERSWALPGVHVRVATIREYVDGPILAHILGYMTMPSADEYSQRYRPEGYGVDERVGAAGVEQIYETDLHGRPGAKLIEVDAAGRSLRELQERPPEPGRRLVLSLDAQLHRAAHRMLEERTPEGTSGLAIVMDPRNGEVLAMPSLPGYNPNMFTLPDHDAEIRKVLSDPRLPLFHRAVAGQYPPGSTFKLVTGLGALEEGTANRYTRVHCAGELRIPNPYNPRLSTRLPDWAALGVLDFVQGLAQSCNVYFYTLGGGYGEIEGLGSERLGRYARLLGYGTSTGIDLPSESAGQVPSAQWKLANFGEPWLPGDTYNMAIGQGFVLATPLQVANLTNAIAVGGVFYRPRVVRSVLDSDGRPVREGGAVVLRRVSLRSETLAVLRDGMAAALYTPQVLPYQVSGVAVAGKTGTAEFPGPKDAQGVAPTHGWFTAYAPADQPRVSVTVFLERGAGTRDAMPLAMDILREYFARYP